MPASIAGWARDIEKGPRGNLRGLFARARRDALSVSHRLMDLGVESFAADDPKVALAAVRDYRAGASSRPSAR
jgi:hypothetical protein